MGRWGKRNGEKRGEEEKKGVRSMAIITYIHTQMQNKYNQPTNQPTTFKQSILLPFFSRFFSPSNQGPKLNTRFSNHHLLLYICPSIHSFSIDNSDHHRIAGRSVKKNQTMPESNDAKSHDIRSPFGKKSLLTFFSHRPATPGTHMRVRGAWGASGELAEGSLRGGGVVALWVGGF